MPRSVARGFSLIGLLIGISIVGILLSLTLAQVSFLDQLLVRTELNQLYATCCYAQQVAQMRHDSCDIVCNQEKNSYTCDNHVRQLPRSVMFGVKDGVFGPPSGGYALITNPISFKDACIRSSANGTLNAGTVYLVDMGKRYQYALSSAVTQVSYIRCYRYDTQFHIMDSSQSLTKLCTKTTKS